MEAPGDKMATTHAEPSNPVPHPPAPKRGKHGKPAATVKFGSASVPVYRCGSGGRIRFAISHYRDGKRLRQFFTTLEAAKKEAQFVARRIQAGMQHVTDLKPHERDNFKAAEGLLAKLGIPLFAAVEDYVRARELAGSESLSVIATEYGKMFGKIVRRATTPEVVAELLKIREQDGASSAYLGQLRTTMNRFAARFPGPILEVTGPDVGAWLRALEISAVRRGPAGRLPVAAARCCRGSA